MLKFTRKNKNLKIPVGIGTNNNIDASGFYDISDADAIPNDLIIGKTAYSAEGFIVGTLNLNEEKENSYNEGYSTGAEAGYNDGYSVGEQEGYNDGYSVGKTEGLEEGREDGYNDGFEIGKSEGKAEGLEEGYDNGFSVGKTEGYNDGYSVGKTDGTTEGYNNGFSAGKTEGLEEGYDNGYSAGNEAGYNTGKTNGIEEGRDEIIEQQSDATITPETVIQGFIGYGANNTRIVGTATQGGGSGGDGFDFTQIGYTQTESNNLNAVTADALTYTKTLYPVDVAGKTSLYGFYRNNKELVYAPYIDTSNITNMGYMFCECSNLIFAPKYDYSKVTTVEKMFSYTNVSEIDLSDASTVTNFSQVASYNPSVTKLIINAASATGNNLYGLLYNETNCKYLKIFNISNKLTTFNKNCFQNSSSIKNIEYVEFQGDTSNVKTETSYQDWFYNCKNLKTVILDIDTHYLRNIEDMFYNCNSLESIPLFNTSNVTNMYRTFQSCTTITSLPSFNTEKVTNMKGILSYCSNLETIGTYNLKSLQTVSNSSSEQYFYGTQKMKNIGGLIDLGMGFTGSSTNYLMFYSRLLTRDAVMNVFNTIYDLNLNTSYAGTSYIGLQPDVKALLSDEDFAIATNKGWTIQ